MVRLAEESQAAASTAFAENLKLRALHLARLPSAAVLTEKGNIFLDARVAALVLQRTVNAAAIAALAGDLSQFVDKRALAARQSAQPPEAKHHQQQHQHQAVAGGERGMVSSHRSTGARGVAAARSAAVASPSPPASAVSPSRSPNHFIEPLRLSVHRKRQLAAADEEYLETIRREAEAFQAEEQRKVEEKAKVRESMRRDMAIEAELREKRLAEERQERQRLRAQVQQVADDVRQADYMDEERRKAKLAREKAAIEEQRVARAAAKERAEARRRMQDDAYRCTIVDGSAMDHELKAKRDRDMRATLLSYLEESKAVLEEKRAQQQAERAQTSTAPTIFTGAAGSSSTGGQRRGGPAVAVPHRVDALCKLQDHVAHEYAAIASNAKKKQAQAEEAAMEAERRTEADRVARNNADIQKAKALRAQLVASLELEMQIHAEREALEKEDKRKRRQIADQIAQDERAAAAAAAVAAKQRQLTLCQQLAAQVEEREVRSMSPQLLKPTHRPKRFLSKTPGV